MEKNAPTPTLTDNDSVPLTKTRTARKIQAFVKRNFWLAILICASIIYLLYFLISSHQSDPEDNKILDDGKNHLYEIVLPGPRPKPENAAFRYPDVVYQTTSCIEREKYNREFFRLFGLDPNQIDPNKPKILVIGSDNSIGSETISQLKKKKKAVLSIQNQYAADFSDHNLVAILSSLKLEAIITCHNYHFTKYTNGVNAQQFTRLTLDYLKSICVFSSENHVKMIFALPPPYVSNQASLLTWYGATVVFYPYFLDDSGIPDFSNPMSRAYFECTNQKSSTIQYIENQNQSMITSKEIAAYLIKQIKEGKKGFVTIGTLQLAEVEPSIKMAFPDCSIKFNPISIDALNFSHFDVHAKGRSNLAEVFKKPIQGGDTPSYLSLVLIGSKQRYLTKFFLDHIKHFEEIEVIIIDREENLKDFEVTDEQKGRVKTISVKEPNDFKAKNIGIRRATGDFIAVVSVQTIFPDSFFDFVMQRKFNPMVVYRSNVLVANETHSFEDIEQSINAPYSMIVPYACELVDTRFAVINSQNTFSCYANPCDASDFLLASHDLWMAVEGFNEYPQNSQELNALILAKFMRMMPGYIQSYLPDPIGKIYLPSNSEAEKNQTVEIDIAAATRWYLCSGDSQTVGKYSDNMNWGDPNVNHLMIVH